MVVLLDEGDRSLEGDQRCRHMSRSLRSKCVAAMVEHLLGEVATVGSSLDPEVPKHGIGLPATKELDVVLVDSSAQKCGGSTRA